MKEDITSSSLRYTKFELPKQSDWQCKFMDFTYVPNKGKEPNRFHRFMQRVLLGVKWSKRK